MFRLVLSLLLVAGVSVPVFYMITRKIFPQHSKTSALLLSVALTTVLVGFFAFSALTVLYR